MVRAVDSRDWIELLDADVLPRNYAAVLSRCEQARHELGLVDDTTVLDGLVERLRALLTENAKGYLDDSNDRSGRYDIYTADLWLFCEPLAPRIGPGWQDGVRDALALVDTVAGPDGAAIPWGRSTGVLAAALTVELAALALRADLRDDRAPDWVRRGVDALRAVEARFAPDGVCDAHQGRDQDEYRGPARRLQLTLDVLGKLAWAGTALREAMPAPVASPAATYRPIDELLRFEMDRNAAVWVAANPGRRVVVPFVGVTRSHYLPVPHVAGHLRGAGRQRPGRLGAPRDQHGPPRHHRRAADPARVRAGSGDCDVGLARRRRTRARRRCLAHGRRELHHDVLARPAHPRRGTRPGRDRAGRGDRDADPRDRPRRRSRSRSPPTRRTRPPTSTCAASGSGPRRTRGW